MWPAGPQSPACLTFWALSALYMTTHPLQARIKQLK